MTQRLPMLGQFRLGAGALHREQPSVRCQQGKAPPSQPVEGRHRPRDYPVGGCQLRRDQAIFDPAGDDIDPLREAQRVHRRPEEVCSTTQRVDQSDGQVGPHDRQHDTWQSRSAADVEDGCTLRQQLGDERAVHQMPIPQPRSLTRTDQAPGDPVVGQQVGEATGRIQRGTEDVDRYWRRRWRG